MTAAFIVGDSTGRAMSPGGGPFTLMGGGQPARPRGCCSGMEVIRYGTSRTWLAGVRYSIAALLCALAIPPTAHATFINTAAGGAITINDVTSPPNPGLGTPYPSTILVEGGDGPILDVDAKVRGLTHNSAADIDLAL